MHLTLSVYFKYMERLLCKYCIISFREVELLYNVVLYI